MNRDAGFALNALIECGGALVRSSDCSEMEIAFSRVDGRFFVDAQGCGYVLRLPDWLARADAALMDIRTDKANEKDE